MAALLAVIAFVVALVFQLASVAFGDFNYVSVALVGLALVALHLAGFGRAQWRSGPGQ